MTQPLKNQRSFPALHSPLPECYHDGHPICRQLCGNGQQNRGLLHAIATRPELTAQVANYYQDRFQDLLTFIGRHDKCLFPQDTERSSDSTPQETSDHTPSLLPGSEGPSGS